MNVTSRPRTLRIGAHAPCQVGTENTPVLHRPMTGGSLAPPATVGSLSTPAVSSASHGGALTDAGGRSVR